MPLWPTFIHGAGLGMAENTHTATPMTATSLTSGFDKIISSSSDAETWHPLTLIKS
jgi:hypothetical protein